MRRFILLKSLLIVLAMGVISGVVLGLAQSAEVWGKRAVLEEADTLSEEDRGSYLLDLRAGDYTTYTHPVYGFSFDYPREFEFYTTRTLHLDETFVRHPELPLGINIYVRPIGGSEESERLVAYVTSLPEDYDAEPPEGADSGAAALMALDNPYPGQYTHYVWFARADHLYEIQLHAPDRELLELWARQVLYADFTLPRPTDGL